MSLPPPEDRDDPRREERWPQQGPEQGWYPAPERPEEPPPQAEAPAAPAEPPAPPPVPGLGLKEYLASRQEETAEEEEDPDAEQPARRAGRVGRIVRLLARGAVLAALAVPLFWFLYITVSRMTSPFELEWLEGEVAIYSIRWQEERSLAHLYPPYDEGNYVPHLYPPLYQIVVAELHRLTGGSMLAVGRFVSLLSTLALMAALAMLVRDVTRSWFAAAAGAMLYPAFFKVGGYWFDLVRVDSFAYALAMWATWLILRRHGGAGSLLAGLVLVVAAHFSKQTAVFIPFLAVVLRVAISLAQLATRAEVLRAMPPRAEPFRHPAAVLVLAAPVFVALVVAGYFVARGALGELTFYLYAIGKTHVIYFNTIATEGRQNLWQYFLFLPWLPAAALWASATLRRWKPMWVAPLALLLGAAVTSLAGRWLGGLAESGSATPAGFSSLSTFLFVAGTWPPMIQWAAAAAAGGLAVWAVRWIEYGSIPRGVAWLGALLAAQYVAAVTWVKIGGYINNYMPLFAVQAVVFGVALGWLFRALERSMGAFGSVLGAALALAVLAPTWFGTREFAQWWDKDNAGWATGPVLLKRPEHFAAMPPWASDGLRSLAPDPRVKDGETPRMIVWGNQLPNPRTREWFPRMIDRLRELHAQGPVYVPHQNYYAHLAGLPILPSADSIRDVNYSGRMTPQPLIARIQRKEFKHIVLMMDVQNDWLPVDMKSMVQAHYRAAGQLMPGVPWDAYLPVTGATQRPVYLYVPK